MRGRNAAFVEYLADTSAIFTTTWLATGKQFWKDRNVLPIVLKWEPEFMDIAESRDFGISTGPWEAQEYRPYTAPVATGYFLSVWKRQSSGAWQVILDAGSTTPARTHYDHAFAFPPGADNEIKNPKRFNVDSLRTALIEREKHLLKAWKESPLPATYASFLAPHARLQWNRHLPTTDADTTNASIAQLQRTVRWRTVGSGAASSGDLGFTYGFLEMPDDPKGSKGHYVRIWKHQREGTWAIILDMMTID
jgi:ketosteroid isomerase-like protein